LEEPEEALVSYKTFNRTARWTAYRQMGVDGAPRQNALAGDAAEREPARIRWRNGEAYQGVQVRDLTADVG
jgi:hypothetical protein